jgi:hypothetical protein
MPCGIVHYVQRCRCCVICEQIQLCLTRCGERWASRLWCGGNAKCHRHHSFSLVDTRRNLTGAGPNTVKSTTAAAVKHPLCTSSLLVLYEPHTTCELQRHQSMLGTP